MQCTGSPVRPYRKMFAADPGSKKGPGWRNFWGGGDFGTNLKSENLPPKFCAAEITPPPYTVLVAVSLLHRLRCKLGASSCSALHVPVRRVAWRGRGFSGIHAGTGGGWSRLTPLWAVAVNAERTTEVTSVAAYPCERVKTKALNAYGALVGLEVGRKQVGHPKECSNTSQYQVASCKAQGLFSAGRRSCSPRPATLLQPCLPSHGLHCNRHSQQCTCVPATLSCMAPGPPWRGSGHCLVG